MEPSRAELDTRTDLTTIKLAARLIQLGQGSAGHDAGRAREIAAALDRICARPEQSETRGRGVRSRPRPSQAPPGSVSASCGSAWKARTNRATAPGEL